MKSRTAIAMVLAACGSPAGSSQPRLLRPAPSGPLLDGRLLGPAQLALARPDLLIEKISDTQTLVCLEDSTNCVCMVPLTCADGHCTVAEDVARFEKELVRETHPVSCSRAETGRWCQFQYFNFEGDLFRWERRWYDEAGAFVEQSNATDYDAYCGGATNTQWMGKIPDCAMPETYAIRPLCSDAEHAGKDGLLTPPMTMFVKP